MFDHVGLNVLRKRSRRSAGRSYKPV